MCGRFLLVEFVGSLGKDIFAIAKVKLPHSESAACNKKLPTGPFKPKGLSPRAFHLGA